MWPDAHLSRFDVAHIETKTHIILRRGVRLYFAKATTNLILISNSDYFWLKLNSVRELGWTWSLLAFMGLHRGLAPEHPPMGAPSLLCRHPCASGWDVKGCDKMFISDKMVVTEEEYDFWPEFMSHIIFFSLSAPPCGRFLFCICPAEYHTL